MLGSAATLFSVIAAGMFWMVWDAFQAAPVIADAVPGMTPSAESPADVSRRFAANLPPRLQQAVSGWNQLISANFAGDQACAECHEKEFQAHLRSGHSRTLTRIHDFSLASKLAEIGHYQDPQRDQNFEFSQTESSLLVRDATNAAGVAVPVTWLLGSGTHAQTPIAVDERTQSGVELRWSYFANRDQLGLTPDHERFDDFAVGTIECFGRPMDATDIRACLGCHSTLTPPPSLPIMNSLVVANVGCERCHGPRKKHVELAHLGHAEEAKPMLQYETAEAYMDACSTCHRDESSVKPDATPNELVRFQPYGIKRSRCYLESSGKMTCSTCHDPHDTVSHNRALSIDQCNQCHGNASRSECSHHPAGDCIQCHMPAVEWTAGISFHDHWIRIPAEIPDEIPIVDSAVNRTSSGTLNASDSLHDDGGK
ncbi:multiheme c-type cytochrome [Novipirellula sp. SH528]|uniref:multiheme c-type cytochrome n=1 Tax=Novipirellula sp. SH528 TaxID=3454466 RepID=UPI003FA165FE